MQYAELIPSDKRFVVEHLPLDLRQILSQFPKKLFVGGGFIRASIAGNKTPSDIDVFGADQETIDAAVAVLLAKRPDAKKHVSSNAITVLTPNRLTIQFITRWKFSNPKDLVASFDFTVCQAAVWRHDNKGNSDWLSLASPRFYSDLAGRQLVYTSPIREEEAGGSMLRVIKYVKRGYRIQVGSLGAVIARLADKVDTSRRYGGQHTAEILTGLLREVDPLHVIDGLDVIDEHADPEGGAL